MKKCTWCGKEYPDEATTCAIDDQPLASLTPSRASGEQRNRPPAKPQEEKPLASSARPGGNFITDVKSGKILFRAKTTAELRDAFQQAIPERYTVSLAEKKSHTEIKIEEGTWRGLCMGFETTPGGTFLTFYRFFIPTFGAKIVIFIVGALAVSAFITIFVSIVMGELSPIGAVGGLVGVAAYGAVENIFLRNIRNGWSDELVPLVENLRA